MVGSSSPDITPKDEPVILDMPKNPNLFLPTTQVEFTFDEITFTTNKEEAFTRAPNQYKEYISKFWYTTKVLPDSKIWVSTPTGEVRGEIGITTFRIALRAQYLPHSSMYVPPPSITTVRPWFATIRYNGEIGAKGTLKKSCLLPRCRLLMGQIIQCLGGKTGGLDQYLIRMPSSCIVFSVHNWILKPNQPEEPPLTDHMKAICNLDVPVDSKAPKYSSPTEEVLQGKKPGARNGLRRKQSLNHTSESTTKASKSQSGHSKKETKSSSAMDTSPGHPSPLTPVVGEMHKEDMMLHQISQLKLILEYQLLRIPYLNNRLEDLSDILKDTRSAFFTPDSPTDEPIIVLDESEEKENAENDKDTEDTSVPPPSLKLAQIQKLMAQPELSKLLASHDFASYLPTKLKELPLKITELSREIKELKQHIKDMEIELPGDLKEIPSKLETFTSTISSLSSQVAELKNIQWELPAEFLDLPHLVSSVQEKLKTLDSLLGLLNKVTNTLNRFATLVGNASGATATGVPLADKATTSPAEG
ncbi:hypothetical protein Tco_1061104, partial [Tanacetum coccineum]